MSSEKIRILCIQLRQIGDVLMTTPAIKALSEAYPNAEIDFLTESPSNQIYECNPRIHQTIKIKRKNKAGEWIKIFLQLRRNRYSIVLDFFGLPKTAFLSWFTGAGKRIGFNFRGRAFFYTDTVSIPAGIHYAPFHKLALLSKLDIVAKDHGIEFCISDEDRLTAKKILEKVGYLPDRPLVTVSPVSRQEYKVWPPEKFAELCDHLVKRYNAQILFLWGPGEHDFVSNVRRFMTCPSLPDYDVPTLRETVALFELADLHIGNDNGPMHFAIAAGCPTVAAFGRPWAINWTPPGSNNHLAVEFDPGCKSSCHYPQCKLECIRHVPLKDMLAAADRQMMQIGAKELT